MTGDDSVWGWLQTILYLLASAACYRRGAVGVVHPARAAKQAYGPSRSERAAWRFLALCCLVLGVNKQLDAQVWLLAEFKQWVHRSGLSIELVQVATVLAAAVALLAAGTVLFRLVRRASPGLRYSVIGLLSLVPFTVLRIARFGGLPSLRQVGGALDVVLELLPTVFVLGGTLLKDARGRPAVGRR